MTTQDNIDRIRNLADLIGRDNAGRLEIADAIRELAHAQRVSNALELNRIAIAAGVTHEVHEDLARSLHLTTHDLFPNDTKDSDE